MKSSIKLDSYYIKNARKRAGHTQVSLANEIGVSDKQIKRIESNGKTSLFTANALIKALNVTLEHLQGKEGTGKYFPHFWCKSYSENATEECEEVRTNIGNIYFDVDQVVKYIKDKVDELFYQNIYSPCEYKVTAKITLNKSENTYYFDISSNKTTSSLSCYRFEIKPFMFGKSGMEWVDYSRIDNNKFEVEFQMNFCSWTSEITDFISDKCEELKDPYYAVQIIFPIREEEDEYFNDIVKRENDKAFLFDKIESLNSFLSEVIQSHHPIEIKDNSHSSFILKPSRYSYVGDLMISLSRVSLSQTKAISWPSNHLSFFIKNLKSIPNSKMREKEISLDSLLKVAGEYGALELRPSISKLSSNQFMLFNGFCN